MSREQRQQRAEESTHCIVVLGMHRSGTSAFAGALHTVGVELGQPIVGPRERENALGFFENRAIQELNDGFLREIRHSWDDLRALDLSSVPELISSRYRGELRQLLVEQFSGRTLWGAKDPRLCILLPLWIPVLKELGVVPHFLLTVRPLPEIACSLRERNGFSPEKSAILALHYGLSAEAATRSFSRVVASYAGLLEDPVATLDAVASALGLRWPDRSDEALNELRRFIKSDLRHHEHRPGAESMDFGRFGNSLAELQKLQAAGIRGLGSDLAEAYDGLRADFEKQIATTLDPLLLEALMSTRAEQASQAQFLNRHSQSVEALPALYSELGAREEAVKSELRRELEARAADFERSFADVLISTWAGEAKLAEVERSSADLLALMGAGEAKLAEVEQRFSEALESQAARLQCELKEKLEGISHQSEVDRIRTKVERTESLIEERTNWLRKIDKELHRDRRTLMELRAEMETRGGRIRRIGQMLRRGICQPQLILPWFKRRLRARENPLSTFLHTRADERASLHNGDCETEDLLRRARNLRFPAAPNPDLSIVIPVFEDLAYTVPCLESLACIHDACSFEVIVVDDASMRTNTRVFSDIANLNYLRNAENVGFVCSCNLGASKARGQYLLFLNNDTLVTHDCLGRLRQTFDDFPDAGAVGGKLIYPDGRLQEAGGIVWKDGSAWNYGNDADPATPDFNYCREVDYCSAALLMIPRALFSELGQFDTLYSPAYYEDTDFAFRVREAGKKVYYQSTAEIIHFEGASCGTDTTAGHKRYQEINARKFFRRWREELKHHRANGEHPELERERNVTKRALIIDHRMLTPDQDSGSVRMWHAIEIVQQMGYAVTFVPDNLYNEAPYAKRLQAKGVKTIYSPFYSSVDAYLEESGHLYDVVILSRLAIAARNMPAVKKYCPKALVVFDTVDLHFLREMREAELLGDATARRTARDTRALELAVARKADKICVVSPAEKELLEEVAPDLDVHVLSNIHHVKPTCTPFESRADLLFIGGFEHPPNLDGVIWFCKEIFPKIQIDLPGVRFHIVGSKPTPEVYALANPDIIVHGYVEDVWPLFETCRLSVAPLRYGAGIKGKVNQSLALGLPCVGTPMACEGIFVTHEWDIMLCEKPAEFTQAVVSVYEDRALWAKLSKNGLANVQEHFSFEAARKALSEVLSVQNRQSD